MPLFQPSSCQLHSRQSADDCDNKRVDNSDGDDHNDVDVRDCYCRDNCIDNCDKLNDVDVRNRCWREKCDHSRDEHDECICRQPNLNCSPLDRRHSVLKRCA